MRSHNDTPSVVERTRRIEADASIVAIHFLKNEAVFVLGEEALLFACDEEERRVVVHIGGILLSACDGNYILTGGDDGKVVATSANGGTETIIADANRRWIDRVAVSSDAIAWSTGKQVYVKPQKGDVRTIDLPSSAGAITFAPKGFRVAIAHYNGVTLWFPNAPEAKPEFLEWKGSHLDVTFSPDGRFLITAMQEPMLHGWRLADGKHMRMSGYATKVRSMSWGPGGKWLATSGSTQLIVWPFQSKEGPMGKTPKMLAPSEHRVAIVAGHPREEICATGFEDGMVLLVRIDDGAEILAKPPGDAPITALTWSANGKLLAFGTENGEGGIIDLS